MEKGKVNYMVYILIFCVVITGIGCFFLGKNFGDVEKPKNEVEKIEGNNKETELFKEENLEDEALGYTLLNNSVYASEYNDLLFFESFEDDEYFSGQSVNNGKDLEKGKPLTYENMSNELKLSAAFEYHKIKNGANRYYYYIEPFDTPEYCSDYEWVKSHSKDEFNKNCTTSIMDKSEFEDCYKAIFGQDKEVTYETFDVLFSHNICHMENEKIYCGFNLTDADVQVDNQNFVYFDSVNVEENTAYVNVKVFRSDYDRLYYGTGNSSETKEAVPIAEIPQIINVGDYLSHYLNDKMEANYRMTFKLDTNNNWYWVSTEAI